MPTTSTRTRRAAPRAEPRTERVQARLTPQVKDIIQQASGICGLSVSDFMVNSSRERAEALIREHRVISLAGEDSLAFARAIVDPAPPNEKLRDLFEPSHRARA